MEAPSDKVEDIISAGFALEHIIEEAELNSNKAKVEEIVHKHIEKFESFFIVPEFVKGLQWFNTCSSKQLHIHKELHGKVTVLDFWTYCCINCMHVLPDLDDLESFYSAEDGLVVVGVHSPKFDNEKDSENIANAILKYNIKHAVVNDQNMTMWQFLGVCAWPTLVILGPDGQMLFMLMGEGHRVKLFRYVEAALSYFKKKGHISNHTLPLDVLWDKSHDSLLRFPGKLAVDSSGSRIAISDTGHNRIIVVSKEGLVLKCIGNGRPGLQDGRYIETSFNAPQGLCWAGEALYFADTENHAIRKIDLKTELVTTVAGTGKMGQDRLGGRVGLEQEISSPWDVCLGSLSEKEHDDTLFIAMAGAHQIWALYLREGKWWKNSNVSSGTCKMVAGSGSEENRNNSYYHRAGFAQPSGISIDHTSRNLYISDSESSSVRCLSLASGAVSPVVGGSKNPVDLFSYGDVDGNTVQAKLQHPLAVAWNDLDKKIYVADTYNHKIKVVDPESRECFTICGSGQPGSSLGGTFDEALFNEPGGLSVTPCGKLLYIADTNNSIVKVISTEEKSVENLNIVYPSETEVCFQKEGVFSKRHLAGIHEGTPVQEYASVNVEPGDTLAFKICLKPTTDNLLTLTEGAPSAWKVILPDDGFILACDGFNLEGKYDSLKTAPRVILKVAALPKTDSTHFQVESVVYVCSDSLCSLRSQLVRIPVIIVGSSGATCSSSELEITHEL